jgi:hypothetical protein
MDEHDSRTDPAAKGPPTHIYVLTYLRPLPHGPLAGFPIGYYTSVAKAEAAQARLRKQPGFRDHEGGFEVRCYRTDEEYDDPSFFSLWDQPRPNK